MGWLCVVVVVVMVLVVAISLLLSDENAETTKNALTRNKTPLGVTPTLLLLSLLPPPPPPPTTTTVGILVSSSYEDDHPIANWVQGLVNGIAAGILIYLGLVEMIAEDFTKPELMNKVRWWMEEEKGFPSCCFHR